MRQRVTLVCKGFGLQLQNGEGIVKTRALFRLLPRMTCLAAFFNQFQLWKRSLFMNLTISGHHLEVTPALRGYVLSKLDRITRHFDQVVDVRVLLAVDNMTEKEKRQRAECSLHVKGRDLFAESSHADLYAAVDELADKLDRQVGRHKEKVQNHGHVSAKRHEA